MMKCSNIFVFALIFVVVLPVAADYTPPGGSGGGNLELGEGPANTVSIIAPNVITDWVLRPGNVNTRAGVIKVSADGDWQVTATDSSSTTNGNMTEWYDGSYLSNPEQLENPMNVSVESGANITAGYEVRLPGGGMIAKGGDTAGQKNVDVTFKQPVSSNDMVLTNGHRYKMVVTLTISPFG
ncbi:MAG: hypothetical protein M0Q43_01765 [Methanothrix sp.]|jgi:hypothetical protein|nr:hypothetical protein [Methanothrix sp.]